MRCLALASALRGSDVAASFVCRMHDGHLCDMIEHRGFVVARLPAFKAGSEVDDASAHAGWLGVSWKQDAEETCAAIEASDVRPDWLVVDHYALDQRWESALRPSVGRIMVIDDLADRVHDCDLLLDQNLVARMHERYASKVPVACGLLLGPEYALLQPTYAELHDRISLREGPIQRIFLFFSGADSDNWTGRTLSAFLQLNRPDIDVDVVITSDGAHAKTIRQQVAGHENIHLHSDLPTLAPLMAAADLAIGAGGATSWERLCMGLPALVVTLAENQRPIAEELQKQDLIHWLGHHDVVDALTVGQALDELIQHGLDKDWSSRCFAAVDGCGVGRVCAALTVTARALLRARHAEWKDEALLLIWANDPTTRKSAFSQEPISATIHHAWLRNRLGCRDRCRLYIVETTDGEALGQVRFECQEQVWEIDYALAPMFRGRGLGRPLLETALSQFRSELPGALVFAQVRDTNYPSRRVFESLGFEAKVGGREGAVSYRRAL